MLISNSVISICEVQKNVKLKSDFIRLTKVQNGPFYRGLELYIIVYLTRFRKSRTKSNLKVYIFSVYLMLNCLYCIMRNLKIDDYHILRYTNIETL